MPQLNFNPLGLSEPQNFLQGFSQGRDKQVQNAMNLQKQQANQIEIENALRAQRLANEEEAAYKAAGPNIRRIPVELMQRGLGKHALAAMAQLNQFDIAELEASKKKYDLTKNAAAHVLANPQNAAQILLAFGQRYGVDMSDDLAQIQQFNGDPAAIQQWARSIAIEADKLYKQRHIEQNLGGVTQVLAVPEYGGPATVVPGSVAPMVPLPPEIEAQNLRRARAGASQTNVTVGTEKQYGEKFAGLVATQDIEKMKAAEKAPQIAATADRILDLLASGKVITGTGANVRLQIAKALNLAGNTDSEREANTEALGAHLAEITLGAISSSGLGAGQGFTNTDRDFLEKAQAGQITFEAQTLARLATLARRAAEKSAEMWNTRVQQIPKTAIEGTGISTSPIVITPRKSKGRSEAAAPSGIDPALWRVMTPQERALWQK